MKKQILILAGSMLVLASCGSNNSNQNTQAQMDSISKANAALQDELNKKKNDSTINAVATEKADSIEKSMRKGSAGREEHKGHKGANEGNQPPVTQAPPPPPATGLKAHSDQNQTQQQQNPGAKTSGGGLKSHSDQNQGH